MGGRWVEGGWKVGGRWVEWEGGWEGERLVGGREAVGGGPVG